MTFARYVPVWSGFPGAPGFTTLHFEGTPAVADADLLAAAVRTMFEAIKNLIPGDVIITYPGEMTIHSDDGTLTGAVALSAVPAPTDCTGLGAYSAPSGARITWETGSIVAGRRIRGRTFLVPLTTASYDSVGTILSTAITTIQNAANGLVLAATTSTFDLVVWSPTTSSISEVLQGVVPDQATVLRSRRD